MIEAGNSDLSHTHGILLAIILVPKLVYMAQFVSVKCEKKTHLGPPEKEALLKEIFWIDMEETVSLLSIVISLFHGT